MNNYTTNDFFNDISKHFKSACLYNTEHKWIEDRDNYRLEIESYRVKKENIDIKYENGIVLVSYKNLTPNNENLVFSYLVPQNVNINKITAKYNNGLLIITAPKLQTIKTKNIEIQ